jgi:hypothetical protein
VGGQLFQVRDVADVDLRREVPGDGLPEPLDRLDPAAGKSPAASMRTPCAFPEQDAQPAVADGQDHSEHFVRITGEVNRITFLGCGHDADGSVPLVIDSQAKTPDG